MTVIKDTTTGKLLIVEDIRDWQEEIEAGEYEYMWEQDDEINQAN